MEKHLKFRNKIIATLIVCTGVFIPSVQSLHFRENDIPLLLDKVKSHYGEPAHQRALDWITLIKQSRELTTHEQLARVNDHFNQLTYISDQKLWGKPDYWASMAEFIGVGGGDCEDYTLAKYYSLVFLGVPHEHLKLVYVDAIDYQEAHMVLAYFGQNGSDPLLLDNFDKTIKPASKRPDLEPIYAFNTEDIWLVKQVEQGQIIGKATTIKPWVRVLNDTRSLKLNTPIINLDEKH